MNGTYVTLARREFWEHRSLWIAPLVAAGFFLVVSVSAAMFGGSFVNIRGTSRLGEFDGNPFMLGIFGLASQVFLVSSITCFVYLLDCLYSERKDRSILFWKSLPVSDAATVLVKFAVAMLIVPLAVYVLTTITYVLIGTALALGLPEFSQLFAGAGAADWLDAQVNLLGMVAATLLWYAPVAAWFMVASVISRRAPILMASMPWAALGLAETILFHTKHVWLFMGYRLRPQPDLMRALAEPNMWLGLVAAAGMLYMVIRLRRFRDDT